MDVNDSESLYGSRNVYRRVLGLNWYTDAEDFMFDFDIICLAAEKLDFFFSIWVFFHEHSLFTSGYLFNFSLPLPPASQTLRHQAGDYCRQLTSAHSQQPKSNREPLVSKRKSLTTKLYAINLLIIFLSVYNFVPLQFISTKFLKCELWL